MDKKIKDLEAALAKAEERAAKAETRAAKAEERAAKAEKDKERAVTDAVSRYRYYTLLEERRILSKIKGSCRLGFVWLPHTERGPKQ